MLSFFCILHSSIIFYTTYTLYMYVAYSLKVQYKAFIWCAVSKGYSGCAIEALRN